MTRGCAQQPRPRRQTCSHRRDGARWRKTIVGAQTRAEWRSMQQQSQAETPNATSSHIGAHNERAAARIAAAAARRSNTHSVPSFGNPRKVALEIDSSRLYERSLRARRRHVSHAVPTHHRPAGQDSGAAHPTGAGHVPEFTCIHATSIPRNVTVQYSNIINRNHTPQRKTMARLRHQ